MTELSKDKTASRQEVVIPITLRGLVKGLRIICFDKPVEYTGVVADHAERLSQRMMSGRLSLLTMPAGIILRNASRTVLGSTSEERSAWWGGFSTFSGVVGSAGALYLTAKAAAAYFGGTVVGATVGTWGSWALGAIVSAPVVLPAFGATFLAGTAIAATAIAALSVVPAVANLGVAVKRTLDAWKGVTYDDTVLQSDKSMSDKLRDRRENKLISAVHGLPAPKQKALFVQLGKKFGAVAQRDDQAPAQPAAAAKASGPKNG